MKSALDMKTFHAAIQGALGLPFPSEPQILQKAVQRGLSQKRWISNRKWERQRTTRILEGKEKPQPDDVAKWRSTTLLLRSWHLEAGAHCDLSTLKLATVAKNWVLKKQKRRSVARSDVNEALSRIDAASPNLLQRQRDDIRSFVLISVLNATPAASR
jgi:hypothetical protein